MSGVDFVISIIGDHSSAGKALQQFGDEVENQTTSGAAKFQAMSGVAVAALSGIALAGGALLYKVGETFDDVADTIRAGTGATGDALDGLIDVAKDVGLNVPAEFEKIGPVVSDVNTRLGLSGDTLQRVASQYLEAGRLLGTDVDIESTSAAFNAFKLEGDAVADGMDTLFQVAQATGVGMTELASGVQAAAPALQNLGFGFEDSVALLGSLDKAGLNATAVTASMSKGLVTLARAGEEPQEAFRRVTGELQGFVDEGNTAAALDLASEIFGTRGASQFVGALQSGVLNMDDLMAATGATGDTILDVGEETMDFAEQWQMLMNTALVAIEPLASTVFAAVGDGLAAAMPFLQELGAWVGENTWALEAIAYVVGTLLVAAVIAWTASMIAANAAMLASPVTWIILGIVALVAAVVWLVMNWDQAVAWLSDVWAGFVGWITGVIDGFVEWWGTVWGGITVAWEEFWFGVAMIVRDIWNSILGWIEGGINGAIDLINGFIGAANVVGAAFGVSIDVLPSVALPRLATGGVTTGPTLALVGDNPGGREVVQPLTSLRADRQADIQEAVRAAVLELRGSGEAGTGEQLVVQQEIHALPGMDTQDLADEAVDKFAAVVRRRGR